MKISCLKSELINAISIVVRGIATKPQTPILSGIFLRAANGELELQATNYDTGFIVKIPAETTENGSLVLPGKYFQDLTRKLPGETIDIESIDSSAQAQITSDTANYTLRAMQVSDFPVISPLNSDVRFQIKDSELRSIVKKTTFSCSKDEQRPIFTGCELKLEDNDLTIAATNIHRLAIKKAAVSAETHKNSKVIVPARFLDDVVHILSSDLPTLITVSSSPNHISFEFENVYMTSRIIEGAFPDYNRVIPADEKFVTRINVDAAELTAAVDRVSLIARTDQYNIIRLYFDNDEIHITSFSPEVGNAEETVKAEIKGEPIKIAFNASYIIEALRVIDGKNCTLNLQEPNEDGQSLSAITITDDSDSNFIYIVTPVRIR